MQKLAIVLAGVLLCAAPAAANPITNAGFETGDFTGWTLSALSAPWAAVVTSRNGVIPPNLTWNPKEGSYFAQLSSGVATNVYTTLSQDFSLEAGQVLTGWAGFDTLEGVGSSRAVYNDDAYVQILDGGTVVSTLWARFASGGESNWYQWQWTATGTKTYTLQFGVRNITDNQLNSFALFDAVEATPVPEPASLLLLGSALGLSALRRRLRRQQ